MLTFEVQSSKRGRNKGRHDSFGYRGTWYGNWRFFNSTLGVRRPRWLLRTGRRLAPVLAHQPVPRRLVLVVVVRRRRDAQLRVAKLAGKRWGAVDGALDVLVLACRPQEPVAKLFRVAVSVRTRDLENLSVVWIIVLRRARESRTKRRDVGRIVPVRSNVHPVTLGSPLVKPRRVWYLHARYESIVPHLLVGTRIEAQVDPIVRHAEICWSSLGWRELAVKLEQRYGVERLLTEAYQVRTDAVVDDSLLRDVGELSVHFKHAHSGRYHHGHLARSVQAAVDVMLLKN